MTKPDPYQCQSCGKWWPVRVLATECCESRLAVKRGSNPQSRRTP